MRLFVVCSRFNYHKLPPVLEELARLGHEYTVPNSYHDPTSEERMKGVGQQEHANWKAGMIRLQIEKIVANDGLLVMNLEKNGIPNYVGGATFLECYQAWERGKRLFFYNPIPEQSPFTDELKAFQPTVIFEDLAAIPLTPKGAP